MDAPANGAILMYAILSCMKGSSRPRGGFTLIELLVVIAIIGLLATVAVFATATVAKKARDTRRLADLKQLEKALDLYREDHGQYPAGTANTGCSPWDVGSAGLGDSDPFITLLETDGYLSKTPRELSLSIAASPCYGFTYGYRRVAAGSACNNGKPFGILIVLFEQTQAQVGLPQDDIDSCGCTPHAGDTCANLNRYGIMLRED